MNSLFLLSLIAHILGDFLFQSNAIAKGRSSSDYEGFTRLKRSCVFNGIHSITHGLTLYILIKIIDKTSHIKSDKLFLLLICICTCHFFIDILKPFLVNLPKNIESLINSVFQKIQLGTFSLDTNEDRINLIVFILDQIFHLGSIILIFNLLYNFNLNDLYNLIVNIKTTNYVHEKVLAIIYILLICTFEAAYFSKFLLNSIKTVPYTNSNNEANRGGFLIGILERLFIILGIVLNHATAIALVLTLKSIARYKKFDNDSFTEYYIIGTFLSFVIAIIGGVCISNII
ncbi:DUF3307 domain-containing protein [uncultured Clostridium sp.]|uniref:DUF3307 domain-containing protein n=1 Tax=uncultured Clostridium sp. TaxID=59620 RepID=UPI0025D5EA72|nr:DUF3307 domain-containing protein [uncultured Clostridium sp.]